MLLMAFDMSPGTDMKTLPLIMLLLLASYVSPSAPAEHSPDSVVRVLYQQVVARRPLGIPKGADKAAISPFLSKELIQKLDAAQACQDDYFRQRTDKHSKPAFGWLRQACSLEQMRKPSPLRLLWSEQCHRRMAPSTCM